MREMLWFAFLVCLVYFCRTRLNESASDEKFYTGNEQHTDVPVVPGYLNFPQRRVTHSRIPGGSRLQTSTGAKMPVLADVRVPKPNRKMLEEAADRTGFDVTRLRELQQTGFPMHLDRDYVNILREEISRLLRPLNSERALVQRKSAVDTETTRLEAQIRDYGMYMEPVHKAAAELKVKGWEESLKEMAAEEEKLQKETWSEKKQDQKEVEKMLAKYAFQKEQLNQAKRRLRELDPQADWYVYNAQQEAITSQDKAIRDLDQQVKNALLAQEQLRAKIQNLHKETATKRLDIQATRKQLELSTPEMRSEIAKLTNRIAQLNEEFLNANTMAENHFTPRQKEVIKQDFLRWGPKPLMELLGDAALKDPNFFKFWSRLSSIADQEAPYARTFAGTPEYLLEERYAKDQKGDQASRQAIDEARKNIEAERKRNAEQYMALFQIGAPRPKNN